MLKVCKYRFLFNEAFTRISVTITLCGWESDIWYLISIHLIKNFQLKENKGENEWSVAGFEIQNSKTRNKCCKHRINVHRRQWRSLQTKIVSSKRHKIITSFLNRRSCQRWNWKVPTAVVKSVLLCSFYGVLIYEF